MKKTEVDVPNSNTLIIETPKSKWHVMRFEFKNGHQNYMCLKGIRLHPQNMLIILNSMVNMIWGNLYDHLTSMRTFTLPMKKMFIRGP